MLYCFCDIKNIFLAVYVVFFLLQFLDWHLQLDSGLPHPLGEVGVWLHQAEKILREELVPQQANDETAKAIHKKRLHDQVKK